MRVGVFVVVLAVLFAAAYVAGRAGLFSSAQVRASRQLASPATRLAATVALADQYAEAIEDGYPTIPGAQSQQTCPAAYAAQAATLVGALTPGAAAAAMQTARTRFAAGGWRIDPAASKGGRPAVVAVNRRGVQVAVVERVGETSSSLEVTVTVACPGSPRSTRPSSTVPSSASTVSVGA